MHWNSFRNLAKTSSAFAHACMDTRPKAAYVGGWTGKQNLGDEALLPAMQKLFPDFRLHQFSGGRVARTALAALTRLRWGIMGGGTLIGQKAGWLTIAEEYLSSGRDLVLFGTGVEEPAFWTGSPALDAWKPVLARCSYLGVRGPISAEAISRLGYPQVEIVGDPVVAFTESTINQNPESNSLGLNVGTADGRVFGGDERHLIKQMSDLAKRARQSGWKVEWFVVWPKDLAPTMEAAEASGTAEIVHTIYEDYHAFISQTRRLATFAGMKLHATLLATCALTPSLMVEYRPKCRDFMQSVGQDEATIRADEFYADRAWEMLRFWNDNRASVATSLASGMHALQERQCQLARRLTEKYSQIAS